MGERSEYAPGTFSWADLSTTDQEAAKAFYSTLFGWEADDVPIGDGMVYSMMRLGGRAVAAIGPQQEAQRAAGVPPVWNSYVTVASADETADRAASLGATLLAPPFDVMTAGRMAVVQDPQGAVISVWEPRDSIGAELVNVPGALCWNEIVTADPDAATGFYGDLFGWTFMPLEGYDPPYLIILNGERSNGGVRDPQGPEPNYVLAFFATDGIDDAVAHVQELGGASHSGVLDVGGGLRVALVGDPQGAVFGLYEGRLED